MGRGNKTSMGREVQATVLFYLLALSVLAAAQPALPQQRQQRQRAVCSLKLQGHSDPKTLGVLDAHLHCNSTSPVTIGINTTYLGKFAAQFTGVEIVGDLACQQQAGGWLADSPRSGGGRAPLFALLYFCGDYQLTLHRPLVHNISLEYDGGAWDTAIIALGADVEGTVDGGHLAGNNAGSALVALQTAAVTLHNATIIEYNKGFAGSGILATDSANLRLVDAALRNNHATAGGSIALLRNSSVSMDNVNFSNNSAEQSGGAVYAATQQHVTVSNTTWRNNTAGMFGGGLYMQNSTGRILNNTFTQGNNATWGGGVFCGGCKLQVVCSVFVNNSAAANGGAFNADQEAQVTVLDTTWNNNTAGGSGGGLYMQNSTGKIINSTFTQGNNATSGGGVCCDGCMLQVTRSVFVNNSAAWSGGAMYAEREAQVTVSNTTWKNNKAVYDGGGLSMHNATGKILNSTFTQGNTATNGGGVRCVGCMLQVASAIFVNNSAAMIGGAMYAEREARVTVSNTTWKNNKAVYDGGGLYMWNANVTVLNTTWNNNTAGGSGGGLLSANSTVTVVNTTWNNNTAGQFGGGLAFFAATNVSLRACTVMWNTAERGGGLYCTDKTGCSLLDSLIAHNRGLDVGAIANNASLLLLGNSTVTGNKLQGGWYGGGVYLSSGNFQLDQVVRATHNNSATFNDDISSDLTHISVVGESVLKGYVNRPGTDEGLLHVALNMTGYKGLPCEGEPAQALLAGGGVLATNRSDAQGIAHLSFKVASPPGQYDILVSAVDWSNIEAINIVLHIRDCARGEVAPSPNSCQVCQQGYFSFDPTRGVCNTCPSNANCTGGDVILPLPGYWRSSANSTQVHRCPNPGACNITRLTLVQDCSADPTCGASDTFKDLQCSQEYYGNLCGMCKVGTGATKLFVCQPCLKPNYLRALYVVAAVVMLVFIMLLCHLTRNQSRDALLGVHGKLPAAELLRPLVLYSQYMLIVSGMNFEWPASISYPLKILAWFWSSASPATLSIECLLPQNASLPASIQKVLFYLLAPVMLLLLVALCEAMQLMVKHARSAVVAMELRDRLFSTILVALFFFLPSILRTVFSMFACVLIDQAAEAPYIPAAIGSFWVYDMNQQCFTGYHRAWAFGLGLPMALLVSLGIPIGMLLLLSLNKSRLKETAFIQHYSFLYKSYIERFYYWESMVVCQTIILVAISVFGVNLGTHYQVIVMNAALMIMVVLLLACEPYLYPQAGRVMLQAMLCLLLTSYVAHTFLDYGDVSASPVYRFVMGWVLLVANMTFIASVVWQMGKLVEWKKLAATIQKLVHQTIYKAHQIYWRAGGRLS